MARVRSGDTVLLIAGKDRGKRGRVTAVFPRKERLTVEGLNIVKRHIKPSPRARQAGIVEQEAPLHLSNVMLVCTRCDRPTRVGHTFLQQGERQRKVRTCRRCGEIIDNV